jgi:hypothetical protein
MVTGPSCAAILRLPLPRETPHLSRGVAAFEKCFPKGKRFSNII